MRPADGVRAGSAVGRGGGHRVPGRGAVEAAASVAGIGSRPMCAMPGIWPGCCIWGRSSRSTVPSVEQEAARDLVRAREDVRGDLMSARHRLSKLLLRQGIVYSGGTPWTGPARSVAARPAPRARCSPRPGWDWRSTSPTTRMLATAARRDRLDAAITEMAAASEFTPVVTRLGCLRGVSTLTAFGLAVEIGDWHRVDRPLDRRLPRAGAHRVLLRGPPGRRGRSPRPATATPAGC